MRMSNLMKHFKYDHLPQHLQGVSRSCAELAAKMDTVLTDCAEKTAGLRKLLEAKDCFVRASLETQEGTVNDAAKRGYEGLASDRDRHLPS